MKVHNLRYFFCFFLLFLGACSPTTEPGAAPAGDTAITTTLTATIPPPPTTLPTTEPTPSPTINVPTPVPPTLTPSPSPVPANPDEDAWVGGFLLSHTQLQPGNSSSPNVPPGGLVRLQPADETVATHLASLPTGDVLVLLVGDIEVNEAGEVWLVVKEADLVNLPYTEDTPLTEVYVHAEPTFSFSYPAGWFITPLENNSTALLRLHNIPAIVQEQGLWPGREFIDPTQFDFTLHHRPDTTLADHLAQRTADSPCLDDLTELTINNHTITRLTESCYGVTVEYILLLNDQLITLNSWATRAPFIERILSTLN